MIRRKKKVVDDGICEAEELLKDGSLRLSSAAGAAPSKLNLMEQLIPPALAVCLYWNSLGGAFVHDDLSAITGNRDVIGPVEGPTDPAASGRSSWDFLYNDFWGTSLLDPRSHKSYRPLTVLTFKWNYALSGLNPWSYHAVNVALHAAVCWLFLRTCRLCFRLPGWTSLLAASLFAIHPIHTEAVSGVVGRADILAAFFFLLSFICHHGATSTSSKSSSSSALARFTLRGASLISAFLALAAKENGIACLPIAVTWDFIRQGDEEDQNSGSLLSNRTGNKWGRRMWSSRERSCWAAKSRWLRSYCLSWRRRLLGTRTTTILFSIVTTLILLAARVGLQRGQLPLFSEQDNPAAFASSRKSRILTLLYLPAFNMGLLLAPVTLSYDWQNGSIPLVEDWWDWRNLGSAVFYTSLIAGIVSSWIHRKRAILWSAAVLVWPMLPASNLFYPCGFVVAERLLYLPSLGYCLIVALGLGWIAGRRGGSSGTRAKWFVMFLLGAAAAAGTSLAAKTWTRNADWADRKTLFESGLRTLPNNAKMHYNYANVQKDDGRWDEAIHHYRQAIQLWPNYASALNNLGTVLLAKADEMTSSKAQQLTNLLVEEAESRFREAIRSHPDHVHAHYNLAVIHMQRNETDQAEDLLLRCLQLNPQHREAHHLLRWIREPPMEGGENHQDMLMRRYGIRSISRMRGTTTGTNQPHFSSVVSSSVPPEPSGYHGGFNQLEGQHQGDGARSTSKPNDNSRWNNKTHRN